MEVTYNREQNALRILEELNGSRETRQNCDFVIKVETSEIHVHRNILCANCELFRAMLSHDTLENQTGCVQLKGGMDASCVQTCVDYMYCRKIFVSCEMRQKLLWTVDYLQLHNFKASIAAFYEKSLNEITFFWTRKLAEKYHCVDLEKKCNTFALENFEAIAQLDKYKDLTQEYITYLLESEENKTSSTNKVKALLNWVRYDQDSRKSLLLEMLGKLSLSDVTARYKYYLLNEEPLTSQSMECLKILGNSYLTPGTEFSPRTPSVEGNQSGAIVVFDDTSRCLQLYDPKGESWVQRHPIRDDLQRNNFTAVSLKNFIYVLTTGKETCRLNFSDKGATWEQMPDSSEDHGNWPPAIAVENFIYVIGRKAAHLASIEKFNHSEKKWETLTHRSMVTNSTQVLLNDSIYCIGGLKITPGINQLQKKLLKTVQEFDLISKEWRTAAPLLQPRALCAGICYLEKIYIIGGLVNHISPSSSLNAECYDPISNTWSSLTSPIHSRVAPQVFLVVAKIFAVGGKNMSPSTMEKYSIKENEWSLVEIPEEKKLNIMWSVEIIYEQQDERNDDL